MESANQLKDDTTAPIVFSPYRALRLPALLFDRFLSVRYPFVLSGLMIVLRDDHRKIHLDIVLFCLNIFFK